VTPSGQADHDPRDPVVELELDENRVGVLRVGAPPGNVLTPRLMEEVMAALDVFEAREGRVLIVGSAIPGVFVMGGDVEHVVDGSTSRFVAYMHAMRELLDRLDGLEATSIAAMDGTAVGGGLELALACTMRVAGRGSRLGLPQVKLGVIPVAGGTQRLPRIVGRGRALDLLVTGRTVDVDEAYEMHLVDRRAEEGGAIDVAAEMGRQIARASGPAVRAVRRAADAASADSFPQGMAVEAREGLALFERGEAREGFAAFLDHRRPDFA
jgi:enoyl-CoA hydratase